MAQHFARQIERLKQLILQQGGLAEQSVAEAIQAVEERDQNLAWQVIDRDKEIDRMDIEIGEECLHTLALYQPVASDLRFVVTVITINKDLERIGDLAVNLAEQALFLTQQPPFDTERFGLFEETQRVRGMLRLALDALVHRDAELAVRVRAADTAVDDLHRSNYLRVEEAVREQPEDAVALIQMINISRQLERIADHAVNIAEDVYYMVKGEVLRHKRWAASRGEK